MKMQINETLIENIQKHESITIEKLVKLSGIENLPNFKEFDYAIPIDSNGKYPLNGNAISVYWDGLMPEIVSYKRLTIMALHNLFNQIPDVEQWETINDIDEYRLYVNYVKLISSVKL